MDLFNATQRMFQEIERTDEGKKVLGLYKFVVQFDITDGEPFHVDIDHGLYSAHRGRATQPDPMCVLTCECDRETLAGLVIGRLEPVETSFKGQLFIPGAIGRRPLANCTLRLLRIGQESMWRAFLNGDAQVAAFYLDAVGLRTLGGAADESYRS